MKSLFFTLPILFGTVPVHSQDYYYQRPNYYYYEPRPQYYCRPVNTALGALLGGGIAASMSRGNGYAWSVPVGAAIGGAVIGCRRY